MNCDKVGSLISGYIDRDLNPGLTRKLEEHVSNCGECTKLMDQTRNSIYFVKGVAVRTLPDDFIQGIDAQLNELEKLKRSPQKPLFSLALRGVVTAALIILVLIVVNNMRSALLKKSSQTIAKKTEKNITVVPREPQQPANAPDANVPKTPVSREAPAPAAPQSAAATMKMLSGPWMMRGIYSGFDNPFTTVIKTKEDLQGLWENLSTTDPMPNINFDDQMLIGIFMGEKPSSGFGVYIISITRESSNILVRYRETSPKPNEMTLAVLSQPFQLITTGKSSLPVIFEKLE
jgi:hypothetical protein